MRNESFTEFDMGDGTAVPLHQRMRTASRGPAAAWSGTTEARKDVRQAFLPPALAEQLTLPIEHHPEFAVRMSAARAQAEKEGMADAERRINASIEKFAQGTEKLLATMRRARMPRAGEIADLALAVARQIVAREVAIDPGILTEAIKKAMDGIESPLPLVLHICPTDADAILAIAPEIGKTARIVRDLNVSSGGFVIENSERIVDATVDARLESVRVALVPFLDEYLSERNELEPDGEST